MEFKINEVIYIILLKLENVKVFRGKKHRKQLTNKAFVRVNISYYILLYFVQSYTLIL